MIINDILTHIVRYIIAGVPDPNWEKVEVNAHMLTLYNIYSAEYTKGDQVKGYIPEVEESSEDLFEKLSILRDYMYKLAPNKGGWYSINIVVEFDGSFKIKYDYDNKPEDFEGLDDEVIKLDHKKYPRDEEKMPKWLKDILERT